MNKPIIYVVEGHHDHAKLKEIDPNIEAFITHGFHFNQKHLNHLVKLTQTYRLILLLDPDGAGARIEKRIRQVLPNIESIHVPLSKAKRADGKVGIEHMDASDLLKLLEKGAHPKVTRETWTKESMMSMRLMGHADARINRRIIAEKLAIPYTNAKQFIHILNRYGVLKKQVKEGLDEHA